MSDGPIKVVVIRIRDEGQLLHLQEYFAQRQERTYSKEDAAAYLKISRPTLTKYVQEGSIKAHKIGRKFVIQRSELDRFMREGRLVVK